MPHSAFINHCIITSWFLKRTDSCSQKMDMSLIICDSSLASAIAGMAESTPEFRMC